MCAVVAIFSTLTFIFVFLFNLRIKINYFSNTGTSSKNMHNAFTLVLKNANINFPLKFHFY